VNQGVLNHVNDITTKVLVPLIIPDCLWHLAWTHKKTYVCFQALLKYILLIPNWRSVTNHECTGLGWDCKQSDTLHNLTGQMHFHSIATPNSTLLKSTPLVATNITWWTYPLPWPKPFTAPSSPQATSTCNKHQKPPTWSLQWISCFVVLKSMHHYFFCQPCLPKWLFTRATAFFQGLSHYPPIWFLDSGLHPTSARLAIEGSIQHGLVANSTHSHLQGSHKSQPLKQFGLMLHIWASYEKTVRVKKV